MGKILRYALGLVKTAVEGVRLEGGRAVVSVRPWAREGLRCPVCGRRCEHYDTTRSPRLWRAMDAGRLRCYLEYRVRRVRCPEHGVRAERVPWARPRSRFTRDFEDWVACLAVRCCASAVAELARVEWHTVGGVCARVFADLEASRGAGRLDGLRRIGVDETSYRKGHRYITVVVDHGTGRLVWAGEVCLVKHAFRKCADEIFGFVLETFSGFVTPVPGPAAAAAGRILLERYRAVDVGRGRADRQEHLDAAGVARRRGGGDLDGAPGQERRRTHPDRPVRPVPQERLGQLPGRHRAPPFPSIRESSSLWLGPPNSTSLPWCTTRSTIAAASLSSANTVPHLLNSTFVVNTTLLLS